MSLDSTNRRNDYVGNGAVDTYSYNFRIISQDDLLVTVADTDSVETTLTLTTDYTVSGVGAASGGSIALVNSGQAWLDADGDLKSGYALTIRRVRDLTQTAEIRNQGTFYPETHEDAFDHFIMIDQQQQDEIDRSFKLPETVSAATFDPTMPADLPDNPGAVVIVNDDGDGFETGPTATEISAAQTYATNASTSATAAATSATNAATSATAASTSATAAAASAVAAAASAASAIPATLIDAAGDLIVGSGADTAARLAGGSDNQVLTYDSALPNKLKWASGAIGVGSAGTAARSLPHTTTANDDGKVFVVDTSSAAGTLTLHAATSGFKFAIVDDGESLATNPITVVPNGAQKIRNIAGNLTLESNGGSWIFFFDGTDWQVDGKNPVTKTFLADNGFSQTWTAPAGVRRVQVTAISGPPRSSSYGVSDTTMIAVTQSGDAYGWGVNDQGQIGNNNRTPQSSPVLVVGGIKFQTATSGGTAAAGIDMMGRAWCWGNAAFGQLGDVTVVDKSSPVLVVGGPTFKAIACGSQHVVALTTDGRAYAWGANTAGQLGDVSVVAKSSPVLVVGGLRFKKIVASGTASMGLTEDGRAYAWGNNISGQLGDATVVAKSSPVAVVGSLTFHDITGGIASTSKGLFAGITTAGAAYCWGGNDFGELGDGTVTDRSSPVAVVGGLSFKALVFSEASAMGLTTAGAAYGWGGNAKGQCGQNSVAVAAYSSPVAVVGSLTFTTIASSGSTGGNARNGAFYGIDSAGVMYAWGGNVDGQLGDGTVVAKSSPVLVQGGLTFAPRVGTPTGPVTVTVTPNSSYSLDFSGPYFSFANVGLGANVIKVELRYFA